jgi:hypothetical protein
VRQPNRSKADKRRGQRIIDLPQFLITVSSGLLQWVNPVFGL